MTNTTAYTEAEALIAVRAALYGRMCTAEADYAVLLANGSTSEARRVARGVLGEARAAYETVRRIAENIA